MQIEQVSGKSGLDQFIRFPWDVYKGNPNWVPPLISDMEFIQGPPRFAPAGKNSLEQNPAAGVYTQMESNFSLFFGLAIQAYESTLVSDRTRLAVRNAAWRRLFR